MAQLKVFSVKDTKGGMFLSPMLARSHGEAERMFKQATTDEKSLICRYPEDYDLYYLGEFDDATGKYDLKPAPEHIVNASSLTDRKLSSVN